MFSLKNRTALDCPEALKTRRYESNCKSLSAWNMRYSSSSFCCAFSTREIWKEKSCFCTHWEMFRARVHSSLKSQEWVSFLNGVPTPLTRFLAFHLHFNTPTSKRWQPSDKKSYVIKCMPLYLSDTNSEVSSSDKKKKVLWGFLLLV